MSPAHLQGRLRDQTFMLNFERPIVMSSQRNGSGYMQQECFNSIHNSGPQCFAPDNHSSQLQDWHESCTLCPVSSKLNIASFEITPSLLLHSEPGVLVFIEIFFLQVQWQSLPLQNFCNIPNCFSAEPSSFHISSRRLPVYAYIILGKLFIFNSRCQLQFRKGDWRSAPIFPTLNNLFHCEVLEQMRIWWNTAWFSKWNFECYLVHWWAKFRSVRASMWPISHFAQHTSWKIVIGGPKLSVHESESCD